MTGFPVSIRPDLAAFIMYELDLSDEEWDALPHSVQVKLALYFAPIQKERE